LQLEPILRLALHNHRNTTCEQHDIRITHPIGRWHNHLVTRVHRGHQRIEQHLLAAGTNRYLRRLVSQAIFPRKLVNDCLLEFGDTIDSRIFRLALLNGNDGRILDILRRIKIRFAKPITFWPSACMARALLEMAMVADG
jgi:hypothetical protein